VSIHDPQVGEKFWLLPDLDAEAGLVEIISENFQGEHEQPAYKIKYLDGSDAQDAFAFLDELEEIL
jgi:hypothetical protein